MKLMVIFVRSFSGSSEDNGSKYIDADCQSLQPDQAQKACYDNKIMPTHDCLITYITSP